MEGKAADEEGGGYKGGLRERKRDCKGRGSGRYDCRHGRAVLRDGERERRERGGGEGR